MLKSILHLDLKRIEMEVNKMKVFNIFGIELSQIIIQII